MLELNNIYNCDCREGLKKLDENSVDLTVTSPPYDSLRTYQDDEFAWNFDIFKEIADELYRVTKPGGVVVWVVGDEVVNGGETGTSFRQALYFQEIGFKIHDTMIYEKNSSTFPAKKTSKRYSQIFEYMFVFVKGKKIRDDISLIADKRNKWAGWTNWGTKTQYDKEGNLVAGKKNIKPTPEFSLRTNIWKYTVSFNDKTGHPAVFPEKLAEDHILSWTNEGDVVLDPFMGSGTTAKMAMLNKRNYIGFEKSEDYYKKSLIRVGKYAGQVNDSITEVAVNDNEGGFDMLQCSTANDNEEEGKTEIFNEIVGQLNEYLNDMSLGILKTLKLTFATKANDRRVENVLKERGLLSGETQNPPLYCEGVNGPQEVGDWTKMEQEYAASECKATIEEKEPINNSILSRYTNHPDAFMKNVKTIMPDAVEVKTDNQEQEGPQKSNGGTLTDESESMALPLHQEPVPTVSGDEWGKDILSRFDTMIQAIKSLEKRVNAIENASALDFDDHSEMAEKYTQLQGNEEQQPQSDNPKPIKGGIVETISWEPSVDAAKEESVEPEPEKKKRGRPKGSKDAKPRMRKNETLPW